jgi:hypothetical protein
MKAAAVRILRALHAALGRWLSVADQSAAVVKGNANPRARTRKSGHKRFNQHTAVAVPSARKGVSWFDLEPGTIAPPKSAEEEESDEWYRAHFRNSPGRR